jgi:hypothetical protein
LEKKLTIGKERGWLRERLQMKQNFESEGGVKYGDVDGPPVMYHDVDVFGHEEGHQVSLPFTYVSIILCSSFAIFDNVFSNIKLMIFRSSTKRCHGNSSPFS